ncbi:MAG TPA: RNA 2',3'-cyclic phosphodiesterase [Solirubrobacterales bacterium]
MAEEKAESPEARLFIALDIPDSVRSEIETWGVGELGDPALRPVSAQSLHLTLCFLGNRPEREIDRLGEILRELPTVVPRIELIGPVARPERGRPRLYALEAVSPQTVALQASLRDRLVAESLLESEKRSFWPHLTVARVRSEGCGSRRPMRVSAAPGPLLEGVKEAFGAVRVTLYRSQIQPQGAQYTPLAQVKLSEGGRQ